MKSVTQSFLDAQNNNSIRYFFEVNMYRRSWNGSAYVYEVTGTDLKPYLKAKSNINWQLDTEGLNIWRVSNVQLELRNNYGEFNEGSGKFFDSTYERFKTKIEIKIGYYLLDGTTEIVYAFTGILVDDVIDNSIDRTIIFTLSGKEILLSLQTAEDVTNVVTTETLGTGALNKVFYTTNKNVLSIDKVYKNDVEQTLTTHYTVSNLYDVDGGAKVTFVTAPVAEDIITCDYTYGNNQIVKVEQIGTGALNSDFYTDYKGVGKINAVYLDGEELSSIDYSVSNLNDKDNFAKITFPVGIGVGQVATCDYEHWYKNIAIETLIGYLLDEAGFPSGQRTIGSIDVGEFLKYEIWNTKAEWDAENNSRNVDSDTNIGSVAVENENLDTDIDKNYGITVGGTYPTQTAVVDFADYNNKYEAVALPVASTPAWTKVTEESPSEEINPAGYLHLTIPAGNFHKISYNRTYNDNRTGICRFKLSADVTDTTTPMFEIYANTNRIQIVLADHSGTVEWRITYRSDFPTYAVIATAWTGITDYVWGDYHTISYEYYGASGLFKIYFDDVEKISNSESFADTTEVKFGAQYSADLKVFEVWIDYYYYDNHPLTEGTLISDSLNLGVTSPIVANLGTLLRTWTDPADGSTLTVYTQTSGVSDFASDTDSWREVTFVGNVGTISASTVSKRYIRWRAILVVAVATSPTLTFLVMPAHILTDTVDCGTNLDSYVGLTTLKTNYNGVVKIYSKTSADDITYDAEVEVVSGVIASTERRYIRFRTIIYFTATGSSPIIQKEYFTYKIDSLNIAMANFSGLTVQSAIEEFAKILDYDIGVDATGKYFFRAKNISVSVDMELSDSTNIKEIDNKNAGWSRIFNDIKVAIGNFIAEMSPVTEGETEPHSITKYGVRKLDIASSNIKVDDDLDLSSGLVEIYYDAYNLPKKSMRLKCKMLPQLELSDTVNVNWVISSWGWFWGDPSVYWGKPTIFWHNEEMLLAVDLVSNIVGLELDINTWDLYITVREI